MNSTTQAFGDQLVLSEFGSPDPNGKQTWQSFGDASAEHPAWAEGFADAYDGGGISPCHVIGWAGWQIPAGWSRVPHGIANGNRRIEYLGGQGVFHLFAVEGTPDHPAHRMIAQSRSVLELATLAI